ncbi:hypothetical protein K443DRAFT_115753, partial [Laccaria amethystina LaAM-08-1]
GSDSTTSANPNSPDFSDRTAFRVHRTTRPIDPFVHRPAKGISPWWNPPS